MGGNNKATMNGITLEMNEMGIFIFLACAIFFCYASVYLATDSNKLKLA